MDENESYRATRRTVLKVIGGLGALLLVDCDDAVGAGADAGTADAKTASGTDAGTANGTCVLDPNVTKGPYWVDEKLDRTDVRTDTNGKASPNPRPGLPLELQIAVYAYTSSGCTALAGAQVDIWHCDASGIYSDTSAQSTTGQNFLRGYQVTNASGVATFTTIYPGWYSGRTVHIHCKVRVFDASQNTTTEATTQLFFDDTVTDGVYAAASPYSSRGARDTRNAADSIYGGHTELLVSLSGDTTAGYAGTITLGVAVGTVFSG